MRFHNGSIRLALKQDGMLPVKGKNGDCSQICLPVAQFRPPLLIARWCIGHLVRRNLFTSSYLQPLSMILAKVCKYYNFFYEDRFPTRYNQYESVCSDECNSSAMHLFAIRDSTQLIDSQWFSGHFVVKLPSCTN